MSLSPEQQRFANLVGALIDGRSTREQHEELEGLLRDNPTLQREYLDQIEIHLSLSRLLRHDWVSPAIPVRPSACPPVMRLNRYVLASLAVAAMLLLMATTAGLLWRSIATPADDVADPTRSFTHATETASPEGLHLPESRVLLAQNSSAEFFGTLAPNVGTAIEMNRQFILTYGSIELVFPTGATTLLEAPAIFSVVSTEHLFLEAGQCSVHAPDGAEGFQLETPLATVIDLGTRFGVTVDQSGETNVQVIEGAAAVSEKNAAGETASPPTLLEANDVGLYPADLERHAKSAASVPPAYRYGLRDRILKYEAAPAADPDARGVQDLLSISVQRGGLAYQYKIEELIPAEVTYFRSTQRDEVQPVAYRFGDERPIAELLKADNSLDTGIFNPGASQHALTSSPDDTTSGMALRFDRPVVNCVGPDIAFFEIQGYGNPKLGDAFHVSPLKFRDSLHSHTIREFDIPMTSPEALEVAGFGLLRFEHMIDSLADLHSGRYSKRYRHFNFRALAVGIDLSDLGYAENEVVEGLFIQDADDDLTHNGGSMVDPVYIGGFPAIVADRNSAAFVDPIRN